MIQRKDLWEKKKKEVEAILFLLSPLTVLESSQEILPESRPLLRFVSLRHED